MDKLLQILDKIVNYPLLNQAEKAVLDKVLPVPEVKEEKPVETEA